MKFTAYKRVAIKSLHLDAADIRRRTKEAHVADLAANIRELGEEPIHAPTVRAGTRKLLCGRDRVAAMVVLKAKKLWVRFVECDDREAGDLEDAENAFRRPDDRTALIARIAARREAYHMSTRRDASTQEVQALANADAARIAGVSVQRVKNAKATARAKADDSAAGDPPLPPESTPAASAAEPALFTLDLLGVTDPHALYAMGTAKGEQAAIDEADKHLRLAQAALSKLPACTAYQELRADVHRVASRVRSMRPEALCPWCKGLVLPAMAGAPDCAPCGGLGYVPAEKRDRAPEELRDGAPMVAVHGEFYPYADVRDGKVEPGVNGTPKAKKTISAQEPDGTPIPLPLED